MRPSSTSRDTAEGSGRLTCPNCGATTVSVHAGVWVMLDRVFEIDRATGSGYEYDDTSAAVCRSCGWRANILAFDPEPEALDEAPPRASQQRGAAPVLYEEHAGVRVSPGGNIEVFLATADGEEEIHHRLSSRAGIARPANGAPGGALRSSDERPRAPVGEDDRRPPHHGALNGQAPTARCDAVTACSEGLVTVRAAK